MGSARWPSFEFSEACLIVGHGTHAVKAFGAATFDHVSRQEPYQSGKVYEMEDESGGGHQLSGVWSRAGDFKLFVAVGFASEDPSLETSLSWGAVWWGGKEKVAAEESRLREVVAPGFRVVRSDSAKSSGFGGAEVVLASVRNRAQLKAAAPADLAQQIAGDLQSLRTRLEAAPHSKSFLVGAVQSDEQYAEKITAQLSRTGKPPYGGVIQS